MRTNNTDKPTTSKRVRVCLDERHGFGHVDRIPPQRLAHQQAENDRATLERQCAATRSRGGKA
ncbi:hypothetical protein [Amycolatopsis pigmentata]|uniref:Uncharacterized protein n=1 Tax=Amycolatopsis pigmentata TaxID=450801 RepID=A0ABW5G3D5_9PSEU